MSEEIISPEDLQALLATRQKINDFRQEVEIKQTLLNQNYEIAVLRLAVKYGLKENDSIDDQTGAIKRKPVES